MKGEMGHNVTMNEKGNGEQCDDKWERKGGTM